MYVVVEVDLFDCDGVVGCVLWIEFYEGVVVEVEFVFCCEGVVVGGLFD